MGRRCDLNALLTAHLAHRCFVLSLVVKTGGPCPTPLRVGPPCTLSVIGPLPMTACRFSLVLTLDLWSVIACHRLLLSGPDREGLVERAVSLRPTDTHGRPPRQLVLPPLAGRAVAGFLILSPSPQSPHSRIGDDLVTLPHVFTRSRPRASCSSSLELLSTA